MSTLVPTKNVRLLVLAAWVIAVCAAAIATGITSAPNWVAVACVAMVPPLVARQLWRDPVQTMSQSIDAARR